MVGSDRKRQDSRRSKYEPRVVRLSRDTEWDKEPWDAERADSEVWDHERCEKEPEPARGVELRLPCSDGDDSSRNDTERGMLPDMRRVDSFSLFISTSESDEADDTERLCRDSEEF